MKLYIVPTTHVQQYWQHRWERTTKPLTGRQSVKVVVGQAGTNSGPWRDGSLLPDLPLGSTWLRPLADWHRWQRYQLKDVPREFVARSQRLQRFCRGEESYTPSDSSFLLGARLFHSCEACWGWENAAKLGRRSWKHGPRRVYRLNRFVALTSSQKSAPEDH